MELSSIIKNNCIFDLSRGCGNTRCNQPHIPKGSFKSECTKYINTPSSIPGLSIDVEAFRKIVVEKSEEHKLRHKLMICLYNITDQNCYNCSSGRVVIINVKYFDFIIPVTVCYRNMSRCKQWCTWGMHINFIYQKNSGKMKYSELQFEHQPLEKKQKVVKASSAEQFPALSGKKIVEGKKVEKAIPEKTVVKVSSAEKFPALSGKKIVDEKKVEKVILEKAVVKRWFTNDRQLPFTVHDLIDKHNEILASAKIKMSRLIDQLQDESTNFLKRNLALTDEMNARKLISRPCVACDHCHKPLGIKRCRGCFVKESPHLMSFFYP